MKINDLHQLGARAGRSRPDYYCMYVDPQWQTSPDGLQENQERPLPEAIGSGVGSSSYEGHRGYMKCFLGWYKATPDRNLIVLLFERLVSKCPFGFHLKIRM